MWNSETFSKLDNSCSPRGDRFGSFEESPKAIRHFIEGPRAFPRGVTGLPGSCGEVCQLERANMGEQQAVACGQVKEIFASLPFPAAFARLSLASRATRPLITRSSILDDHPTLGDLHT